MRRGGEMSLREKSSLDSLYLFAPLEGLPAQGRSSFSLDRSFLAAAKEVGVKEEEAAADGEEERSFLRNFFLDEPEEVAAGEKRRRREQQEAAYMKALRQKKEKRDAIRKIFSTKPAPPLESLHGLLSYRRRCTSTKNVVEEEEAAPSSSSEEECVDLEPLFYDEAETLAEYAAGEEKRKQKEREAEQEAREKEMQLLRQMFHKSVLDSICDTYHQAKLRSRRHYHTRFYHIDLSTFDLDEESPLGPMRHTGEAFHLDSTVCIRGQERLLLSHSVNVLSVKVTCSDVGFPINVYGTVIARDSIDVKCVYLFRRDRNNCQLINSEDDLLILTGPKRALALRSNIYFEVNLKIKAEQGQRDKQLSNGFLVLDGLPRLARDKTIVESKPLRTRLSMVEVTFVVVPRAVEATIAIEVVQGEFDGKITARTSTVRHGLMLLHDSKVAGVVNCPDGKRLVQMMRPTVAVFPKEELEITAIAQAGAGEVESTVTFTPCASGVAEDEINCGSFKMLVRVYWSVISFRNFSEKHHGYY